MIRIDERDEGCLIFEYINAAIENPRFDWMKNYPNLITFRQSQSRDAKTIQSTKWEFCKNASWVVELSIDTAR